MSVMELHENGLIRCEINFIGVAMEDSGIDAKGHAYSLATETGVLIQGM